MPSGRIAENRGNRQRYTAERTEEPGTQEVANEHPVLWLRRMSPLAGGENRRQEMQLQAVCLRILEERSHAQGVCELCG